MPARDVYHDQLKTALIKDGWKITHDPLSVKWNEKVLFVDLGAEEVLAAEKDGRKIGVEVKSFVGPSQMRDLEEALGQFVLYRVAMKLAYPDYELYLAVTEKIYHSLFTGAEGKALIEDEMLQIIVFDPQAEEIRIWIP
jgi:XisH protein